MLQGLLAALVSALCWGTYMVPLKRRPEIPPIHVLFWVGISIAFSSLAIWAVRGFPALPWLWGFASGLFWVIGAALSFLAVAEEGLSRASARWMGTGIGLSFALGVLIFHEAISPWLGFPGVVALLAGLYLLPNNSTRSTKLWLGGPKSLGAGLVFGSYLLPLQWSGAEAFDFCVPMSLGIGFGVSVLRSLTKPTTAQNFAVISLGSGLVWNIANLCSIVAIQKLGFAVGFPLTQMALLVSIAWGVLAFGEYPEKKERLQLLPSLVLLLGGALLLGLSKHS